MKSFLQDVASQISFRPSALAERALLVNMHALPSVAALMEVLLECGARPDNMVFIGKPYSTIPAARRAIENSGIRFETSPAKFRAGNLEAEHKIHTQHIVHNVARKNCESITLLDSGGHLTTIFDRAAANTQAMSIQLTSSGSRVTEGRKNLIDLGVFDLKKEFESAAIAKLAVDMIRRKIPDLNEKKICVIGKGAIGEAIYAQLSIEQNVAQLHGGLTGETVNATTDVIIGATGHVLSDKIFRALPSQRKIDFFSVSSWDKEFRNIAILADQEVEFTATGDAMITIPDSQWTIHNGGCPINFNRVSATPDQGIAMTRALTLSAALHPKSFTANVPRIRDLYSKYYL